MTREELELIVTGFMDSHTTLTLACSIRDRPWAAAVYYARQDLELVFFSSPSSRHATVLAENPEAAATIHGSYTGWKEIKGLQMEGKVETLSGAVDRARALATYVKRFPFVTEFFSDPLSIGAETAKKIAKVRLYVFRPEVILYVNNEEGFGKRWRLDVKNGRAVGTPTRA
jgi:uncharacterized protein YhbP (UPF0306 family)